VTGLNPLCTLADGMALAIFEPWIGLLIGIVASVLLIGGRDAEAMEEKIAAQEQAYHQGRAGQSER
jgi:high-affinity Fe2+/Pb2+ permease